MRPPSTLRIGRQHRPACTVCGTTAAGYLVADGDDRYCPVHDPLAQVRARMEAARSGGPFDPAWGALVDEEQDILRRRGLDIFGRPRGRGWGGL